MAISDQQFDTPRGHHPMRPAQVPPRQLPDHAQRLGAATGHVMFSISRLRSPFHSGAGCILKRAWETIDLRRDEFPDIGVAEPRPGNLRCPRNTDGSHR